MDQLIRQRTCLNQVQEDERILIMSVYNHLHSNIHSSSHLLNHILVVNCPYNTLYIFLFLIPYLSKIYENLNRLFHSSIRTLWSFAWLYLSDFMSKFILFCPRSIDISFHQISGTNSCFNYCCFATKNLPQVQDKFMKYYQYLTDQIAIYPTIGIAIQCMYHSLVRCYE